MHILYISIPETRLKMYEKTIFAQRDYRRYAYGMLKYFVQYVHCEKINVKNYLIQYLKFS